MEKEPFISLDNIKNRFLFVLIAAKRALQLQKGAQHRTELGTKKPTIIAMVEVLEDKVQFQLPPRPKEKRLTQK